MSTTLKSLEKLLPQRVPPEELAFHLRLMQQLFSRAKPTLLEQLSAEALLAIYLGAVAMLDAKHPHDIGVRTSLPDSLEELPFTVLQTAVTDRPFLVDSLTHELKKMGYTIRHVLHPIFRLGRDDQGRLKREDNPQRPYLEACQLFFLDPVPAAELSALESRMETVLQAVKSATDGYHEMRRTCSRVAGELLALTRRPLNASLASEVREGVDFLEWLDRDNFIFLSYDYTDWSGKVAPRRVPERALGLLLGQLEAELHDNPVPLSNPPDELALALSNYPLLRVSEAPQNSLVHRPARMDRVVVKQLSPELEVLGEHTFLGLFTSNALRAPLKDIPLLRHRLQEILSLDPAFKGSHDYKRIVSIADSIPREELFWSAPTQLHRDIRMLMDLHEGEVRATLRPAPNDEVSVMVVMPRDRYSAPARRAIEQLLLDGFRAPTAAFHLCFDEEMEQARLHFLLHRPLAPSALDATAVESMVFQATRTWHESLTERLVAGQGAERGQRWATAFAQAFGEAYLSENSLDMAVQDISELVELAQERAAWRVATFDLAEESVLRIYHTEEALVLSDVLPRLENLGMRVLGQNSYPVEYWQDRQLRTATIESFRVKDRRTGGRLGCDDGRLTSAVIALMEDRLEDRPLNGLILASELSWREVILLGSYASYLAQVSVATSRHFIVQTMLSHPQSATLIARYFQAKFCPDRVEREEAMTSCLGDFQKSLETVSSLAQDRILRALMNCVQATVRSNYYLNKEYLSHKIDSQGIDDMPEPRPLYEIFVVGPGVEGVHLRGGMVSRGGLRWSDRPDDFRTEVLGLMKTQMAKNAVIVPVGSKGGFVLKHPPTDRQRLASYVVEQYRTFIRGLLDLTDNYVDGQVCTPPRLIVHDQADPYLVVAADKGTAKFSDVANAVAAEYGFWLGDAFASGGTFGYDHKKEGITARGAWECVKRHFHEMGIEATSAPLTCVGIGDMSGDVFGNGMLYSDKILLQAAFNHQHVFLDPNPDANLASQERQRLFTTPGTSWSDYDPTRISEGGGVFLRAAKAIPLSPQVRQMLDTDQPTMTGEELVSAVLSMPVDLLWNGGIGTYVRGDLESQAAAEDSANDAVRITASQLRARVVGEGGNGGFTQAARLEYAQAGGRINTDAIDNSAGVDLSDHEVNIKILLQGLIAGQELTPEERNQLLADMAPEVTRSVLSNNFWQSVCLSLEQRRCPNLTRPQLAIAMAQAKMRLKELLLASTLAEESQFEPFLTAYFPRVLSERYPEALKSHALRKEIVVMQMSNRIVNLLGLEFVERLVQETGEEPLQVARAVLAAMELLGTTPVLESFASGSRLTAETEYALLEQLAKAVEEVTRWLLLSQAPTLCPERMQLFGQRWQKFSGGLEEVLLSAQAERLQQARAAWETAGVEAPLAHQLAALEFVVSGLAILDRSWRDPVAAEGLAQRYFELGERLRLDGLRSRLEELPAVDRWSGMARAGLLADLQQAQLKLASVEQDLETLPGRPLDRFRLLLGEIEEQGSVSQASGDVLARLLHHTADAALRRRSATAQNLSQSPQPECELVPLESAVAVR